MTMSPTQPVTLAEFRNAVSDLLNKVSAYEISSMVRPGGAVPAPAFLTAARERVQAMLDSDFAPAADTIRPDDLAAAFNSAVDAEYPLPDSPHASVIQRATDNRAAMWRGINAARRIFGAQTQQPAALADGAPKEVQSLSARIWRRKSTSEWVLELQGVINDTGFTCRHTEPLTTPIEDVPGLPSLHAVNERHEMALDDTLRSARELARLLANTSQTQSLASEASRVVRKIDAFRPSLSVTELQGDQNG